MESKYTCTCANEILKVELCGRLDATNAEGLQTELKKFIGQKIAELVFLARDLEYISSAGLRVIIFAKQKIGADAKILLVAPRDAVLNVIKMSGLDNFMAVVDTYTK
ncbi:MAG TPA: STAS domain-containing protein [Candidatus Omnitrophota bacterium]|nr:STAS domain-containing protein [Candidatus Omnitrophota bacterium]HQJ16305.1 STAS domain-containing protein [Candidatus Omnitrophota bacterium]